MYSVKTMRTNGNSQGQKIKACSLPHLPSNTKQIRWCKCTIKCKIKFNNKNY